MAHRKPRCLHLGFTRSLLVETNIFHGPTGHQQSHPCRHTKSLDKCCTRASLARLTALKLLAMIASAASGLCRIQPRQPQPALIPSLGQITTCFASTSSSAPNPPPCEAHASILAQDGHAVGSVTMLEIPQARMAMLWSHEHFPAYMMDFEEDDCTFDLGQSCFPAAREEQWPTSHMPRALQPSTTLTCQLRRTHVYSGFRTKDVNVCTVGSSILRRLKSSSETGASPIVLTTL